MHDYRSIIHFVTAASATIFLMLYRIDISFDL